MCLQPMVVVGTALHLGMIVHIGPPNASEAAFDHLSTRKPAIQVDTQITSVTNEAVEEAQTSETQSTSPVSEGTEEILIGRSHVTDETLQSISHMEALAIDVDKQHQERILVNEQVMDWPRAKLKESTDHFCLLWETERRNISKKDRLDLINKIQSALAGESFTRV